MPADAENSFDVAQFEPATWPEMSTKRLAAFREQTPEVQIGKYDVPLTPDLSTNFGPGEDFEEEPETLWSFPDRGSWATHKGNYRGNWSPYIPRNLLVKFTEPGDVVLDQMCGSGTTLVECKLLGRHGIGVDVNEDALYISQSRLDFEIPEEDSPEVDSTIRLFEGDARDLSSLPNDSVDLVATHPPYANIIKYTRKEVDEDLSSMAFPEFLESMEEVAQEACRVLKPGKYCAILAGDTRKKKHYVPVSLGVLNAFLDAGFILKEDIIKAQHNTKATIGRWKYFNNDFQLIAHEHLYILRKPEEGEDVERFPWSTRWW